MIDPAIAHLWEFLSGATALKTSTYEQIQTVSYANRLAIYIVLLASVSEAIAQSIVLFANKVKPLRFVLSIGIAALLLAVGFLFWAGSTWLASTLFFGKSVAIAALLRALGLSFAPRVFSFFIALPYLGVPISVFLSIWSLLSFLIGLKVVLGNGIWQAFSCAILGWAVLQILQRTIGKPFAVLGRWLRNSAAGVPLVTNLQELERIVDLGSANLRRRP